ncbi:MAG: DNA repair protein RecN [Lachnospirales bacterium]
MLKNIFIKNVALIKEETVDFKEGLNIISGETGAGKSMFIDSISFILGGKSSKDFIRFNEQKAEVVGLFSISEETAKAFDLEEEIVISRTLTSKGTNTVKLNGRPITLSMLKEISPHIIDLHLQNHHNSLVSQREHIVLLDMVANLKEMKEEYIKNYRIFKGIERDIIEYRKNEKEVNRTRALLEFQVSEIEEINPQPTDEEEIYTRYKLLSHGETINEKVEEITMKLYNGGDNMPSAYDIISSLGSNMEYICDADESKKELQKMLYNILDEIEVINHELSKIDIVINEYELQELENRIEKIESLKKKYGNTVEEVLNFYNEIKNELENIKSSQNMDKLKSDYIKQKKICIELANNISKERMLTANRIEKDIVLILNDLGMKDVQFKIIFEKKEKINENGYDDVNFMISTNKGNELKHLEKIASGGEMSRIIIALKTIISEYENIDTFIFDEIDTGVSGPTAHKVGEKLSYIGKKHQILCITHLPQIAAMSDSHFKIHKISNENETITYIDALDESGEIEEIARLIGGAKQTQATIEAAREMKSMAKEIKEKS